MKKGKGYWISPSFCNGCLHFFWRREGMWQYFLNVSTGETSHGVGADDWCLTFWLQIKTKLVVKLHPHHLSEFSLGKACKQKKQMHEKNTKNVITSYSSGYGIYIFGTVTTKYRTSEFWQNFRRPEQWFWQIDCIFHQNPTKTPVRIFNLDLPNGKQKI